MIAFNDIPSNLRTPFAFTEFDNSKAVQGPTTLKFKQLIIGQMLATGTANPKEEVRVTNADKAAELFGSNSMLHLMLKAYFDINKTTEVLVFPLEDDAAAVAATAEMAVTGAATKAGTLYLYFDGVRLKVGVASGDSATVVGDSIVTVVNASKEIGWTAANNAGTVTFTAKNKGEVANGGDIRVGYYDEEKVIPAGIDIALTQPNGGTGNPDLSTELANLPEEMYNVICAPYTDAANLAEIDELLTERFGPLVQIDGIYASAIKGTHSALGTKGDSLNSKHISLIEAHDSPSSVEKWAAAYAAVLAFHAEIDPARPFQTLPLTGILAEEKKDRFTRAERDLLLFDGISTHYVDDGNIVRVERAISTYKTNELGADDTSYLDLNTLFTLSYLRYDWNNSLRLKYPRHKLKKDGTRVATGQPIVTPKLAKAEAVAKAKDWVDLGIIESVKGFKDALVVEISQTDPNRLNWLLTPDLVNQLRVNATQIGFLL